MGRFGCPGSQVEVLHFSGGMLAQTGTHPHLLTAAHGVSRWGAAGMKHKVWPCRAGLMFVTYEGRIHATSPPKTSPSVGSTSRPAGGAVIPMFTRGLILGLVLRRTGGGGNMVGVAVPALPERMGG